MRQDYHDLLKPEIIRSVSGLALIARVIVDGYLSGVHHSRRVGSGMEFSQFRTYQSGDDLRLLDWKMLARSGRYYIRQSEIETNISIKFILDSSASMLHEEGGLSKMDYARVLIATLSYLAQHQGDAIGLFAMNDQELHNIYSKIQKQHFNRLLMELMAIENKGKWPSNTEQPRKLHERSHKELIFFITDMYEYDQELIDFIKQLKTLRNEVVVLHCVGGDELEFNYKGNLTFEDLETGDTLKVNASEAKKTYLQGMDTMMKTTRESLLTRNIGYHLYRLDDHIGELLRVFLKQRMNLL